MLTGEVDLKDAFAAVMVSTPGWSKGNVVKSVLFSAQMVLMALFTDASPPMRTAGPDPLAGCSILTCALHQSVGTPLLTQNVKGEAHAQMRLTLKGMHISSPLNCCTVRVSTAAFCCAWSEPISKVATTGNTKALLHAMGLSCNIMRVMFKDAVPSETNAWIPDLTRLSSSVKYATGLGE